MTLELIDAGLTKLRNAKRAVLAKVWISGFEQTDPEGQPSMFQCHLHYGSSTPDGEAMKYYLKQAFNENVSSIVARAKQLANQDLRDAENLLK